METPPKERTTTARLTGMGRQVRYPIGTADFLYQIARPDGSLDPEEYALRLVVSSDECRQLASHLTELAEAIEALGGSKQ